METRAQLTDRWRREGREAEVSKFREAIREECKKQGLKRQQANDHAWKEAARNFPPIPPPEPATPAAVDIPVADAVVVDADEREPGSQSAPRGKVAGLERIPESWGELPASATLSAELGWVQSNRLWIVSESSSGARVDLSKAREPAPSRAALAWLETSVRNYAKFTDVLAKIASGATDEQEDVRRERTSLAEIERLLAQMAPTEKIPRCA